MTALTWTEVTQGLRARALETFLANPDGLTHEDLAVWLWEQGAITGMGEYVHGEEHSGQYRNCPWCAAQRDHEAKAEPLRGACAHCRQPIRWTATGYVSDSGYACRDGWRSGPHELMPSQEGNG
jgi:hypothetical protein